MRLGKRSQAPTAARKGEAKMKFEDIIRLLTGHKLTAGEINKIAKEAEETYGLSPKAADDLKMLFLATSAQYQENALAIILSNLKL